MKNLVFGKFSGGTFFLTMMTDRLGEFFEWTNLTKDRV